LFFWFPFISALFLEGEWDGLEDVFLFDGDGAQWIRLAIWMEGGNVE